MELSEKVWYKSFSNQLSTLLELISTHNDGLIDKTCRLCSFVYDMKSIPKSAPSERKASDRLIKGHVFGRSSDSWLGYLMLQEEIHADKDIKTIYKFIFLSFEE